MKNPIKTLKITNFKSIKELELDCARINIFVGKPNVGKSNILEALGLFCAPYSIDDKKFLSEFVRYNNLGNLFYDNDFMKNTMSVETNLGNAAFHIKNNEFEFYSEEEAGVVKDQNFFAQSVRNINNEFSSLEIPPGYIPRFFERLSINGDFYERPRFAKSSHSPVKKYTFKPFNPVSNGADYNTPFLLPPSGRNLFNILQSFSNLRKKVSSYFDEYGLKLLLDFDHKSLHLYKEVDGIIYKIPINLIADTLQRIIFHYAAIESNKESILLFEEPENHSFPPYIKDLAEKIVEDNSNQYFITTHSPYLLNTIIENADDLAVFVTGFKNYETVAYKLIEKDISEISNYGVDVFFNLNWFEDE